MVNTLVMAAHELQCFAGRFLFGRQQQRRSRDGIRGRAAGCQRDRQDADQLSGLRHFAGPSAARRMPELY